MQIILSTLIATILILSRFYFAIVIIIVITVIAIIAIIVIIIEGYNKKNCLIV